MVVTTTLFRPVGLLEWEKILAADRRRFPPRFPFQPIFYPVLNQEYAESIAHDWNTTDEHSGYAGFVTKFAVAIDFVERYEPKTVGMKHHQELWVPAEELNEFNNHIVGQIDVVKAYLGNHYTGPALSSMSIDVQPEPRRE